MATDSEKLILSISADVTSVKRSLAKLSGDTKTETDKMKLSFNSVDQAVTRTAANMNQIGSAMTSSVRQTRAATVNLTAQMNDIAQQFVAGTSPLTIMAQQGSQVTQALQAAGGGMTGFARTIGGALMGMLSPMNLVSMGLIAITGLAVHYFKSLVDGGQMSEKEMKKHLETLDQLTEKYGELAPAAKETLDEFFRERELVEVTTALKASIDALNTSAIDSLTTAAEKFREKAAEAGRQAVLMGGAGNREAFDRGKEAVAGLIDVLESGDVEASLARANELLAEFITLNNEKPGKGFDEYANLWRDIIPLLETAKDRHDAILILQQEMGKAPDEAIQKMKDYKKATEELKKVIDGPLTNMEKMLQQHKLAIDNAVGSMREYVNATGLLNLAMAELNKVSIGNLTGLTLSNMDDYTQKVMMAESGGKPGAKNPDSSASGLFQFLNTTFEQYIPYLKSLPDFADLTEEQIRAQKNNVDVQKAAFKKFTQDNADYLEAHGVVVNDATLYMAHVLGKAGAVATMQAAPGTSVSRITGSEAARLNPSLLGNRTVEETYAAFQKKMGTAASFVNTQDARDRVAADREDAEIQGRITDAYDEQAAAEAEKLKFAQLRRDLEKKAREEMRGVSEEELARAREIAKVHGETVGREKGKEAADKAAKDAAKAAEKAARDAERAGEKQATALEKLNEMLAGTKEEIALKQKIAEINAQVTLSEDERTLAIMRATEEAAKLATVEKLLAQAKEAGIPITAALRTEYEAMAQQLVDLAVKNKELEFAQRDTEKAADERTKSLEKFTESIGGMAKTAISGFVNDLRNGVEAGEAFSNMLDRVVDSLLNMALETLFSKEILGTLFSGLSGIGGGAGLFPAAPMGGGLFKAGGTVGMASHSDGRSFGAGTWAGAPRFAAGGMVGLRPGEIPIIAHKGEMVIPTNQVGKGGGTVDNSVHQQNTMSIDMSQTGAVTANNEDAKLFGFKIQKLVQLEMVKESRPGGLLRQGRGIG